MTITRHQHITKRLVRSLTMGICFVWLSCSVITLTVPPVGAAPEPDDEYKLINQLIEENLFKELSQFVEIETYRGGSLSEDDVVASLEELRDDLMAQAKEFNEGQTTHKLMPFEWKQKVPNEKDREYWVFGLRLGKGDHKIALSSHLDTVPPGSNPKWEPFILKKEWRKYLGKSQQFYVARGAIDDKGPAIVAFNVLKAVARRYDGSPKLDNVTIELIFDTSEETDMSMPHYLEAEPDQNPDFGLIYDASWSIRAEKGIERPVFTIERATPVRHGMWIEALNTPQGPTNQIPDTATAVIKSHSPKQLEAFAKTVHALYLSYPFDDPTYRRAKMTVTYDEGSKELRLVTQVDGAQHGSAPNENREDGANPLVSLANFLGGLVDQGGPVDPEKLVPNEIGRMCQFISWAWGTKVFGEHHSGLLERHDEVFTEKEKNGTTYALTRFYTKPAEIRLEIDIRYAIGHHSSSWDGETEGFLSGDKSIFEDEVFPQLLEQFNNGSNYQVTFSTQTIDAPDIRLPGGESFSKVSRAYEQVIGEPSPARAIGGGTDAKGHTQLIAAGALFTERLGPPINFHGFNEGAPVSDLKKGARIIYRLFVNEIEDASSPAQPDE